jgi:HNH endonuclease
MKQKHVLNAINRIKSGQLGSYADLSTKHYVIDPRDGTPWDLKAVVGLAKQLANEENDLGKGKAHSDLMIRFLQVDAPEIVVLSFRGAKHRRLGIGEKNLELPIPDWAYATLSKDTDTSSIGTSLESNKFTNVPRVARSIMQYVRSGIVQREAIIASAGICGDCKQEAPFKTSEGLPFLEVHHVVPLAKGGADKLDNVIALCPNCHRKRHYGPDGIG